MNFAVDKLQLLGPNINIKIIYAFDLIDLCKYIILNPLENISAALNPCFTSSGWGGSHL